jgi:hypothetical protein
MTQNIPDMVKSLCVEVDANYDDATQETYDYYGLDVWSIAGADYAVGTDEDCDTAAAAYISDSVWAFNADWLCNFLDLPDELAHAIASWQKRESESANEGLLKLVQRLSSVTDLCDVACREDGRGHFLSPYDGDEIELADNCYAYRVN